jgi:hypothetical protein
MRKSDSDEREAEAAVSVSRSVSVFGTARALCDAPVFRAVVAIALLPFAAFAFASLMYAGLAVVGLATAVVKAASTPAERLELLWTVAVFGSFVVSFAGIVLRLAFTSAALAERPGLRRAVAALLTTALAGLVMLAFVQPGPYMLVGLALIAICWLGTLRLK